MQWLTGICFAQNTNAMADRNKLCAVINSIRLTEISFAQNIIRLRNELGRIKA